MKTFALPGGLAGPPSACSAAPNRIDVFAAGPGNTVWRWSWDGTNWTPPMPLPLIPGQGIPAEGVCAVASGPGRVEVFAAEKESRSPVWWRGDGANWRIGAPLQAIARLPAGPVTAVCASPNDIDVYAVGDFNTPWWWHWNGSWWTGQGKMREGASLGPVRLGAVLPAPDRRDVFAAGALNHLWQWSKVGNQDWTLQDRGGNLPAEGVSAVSWGLNRIDVFAASLDPGNPLQHWWWSGGGIAGPESLGGSLVQGTVSAGSHAPDRRDVFGVSPDKRLAHWYWNGRSWAGPDYVGGDVAADDVSAVLRKPHHLDVFASGPNRTLAKWPGGLADGTTQAWRNWPTNHELNPPAGQLWPDSREELVEIVAEAGRLGRGVRAVGSSWSNSDCAVSPAYVVQTTKLNRVLGDVLGTSLNALGSGLQLVHVEAGIKLWELNDYLDSRNLALKTMGGSSGQSLAGVVSTSAHGADFALPPIPDMVRAIHLVGPGGVEHWIEPREAITTRESLRDSLQIPDEQIHYDDELFNSVLVSAGSLGIIYSLVVEVRSQFELEETRQALDWSAVKQGLRDGTPFALQRNRTVQVVIWPYADAAGRRNAYLSTRTEESVTPGRAGGHGGGVDLLDLFDFFAPGLLLELRANPSRIDEQVTTQTDIAMSPGVKRDLAHVVWGGPKAPALRGLTVEVVFDATTPAYLDFIDAALELLHKALHVEQPPLGYIGWISLRFQGRSRAYLSPHHQSERTCTVEFAAVYRNPDRPGVGWEDNTILIPRIEALARDHGAIQHWGMNERLDRIDVGRAYPRLDTWRRARWELTKGGTLSSFDSEFTRRCGLSDPPRLVTLASFDKGRKTNFAVWRPNDASWYVIDSSGNPYGKQLGTPDDVPVPGDYNGDGIAELAVWHPHTGTWTVVPTKGKKSTKRFGEPGDIPVPGDYDGDRRTEFAVWRPKDGTWYVLDATGKKRKQQWGEPGDIPVPGDYDGDGRTDFAVWRPREANWYVIESSSGHSYAKKLGEPGDVPVPGDYDGDGKTDLAVWRPRGGMWYVIESSTGRQYSKQYGDPSDIPVPGRYDSDKRTDFAIWRPSTGTWWVLESSTGQERSQQWGQFGDVPV